MKEASVSKQETSVQRNTFRLSITCFCLGFSSLACAVIGAIIAQPALVQGGLLLGPLAFIFTFRAVGGLVTRGTDLDTLEAHGIHGVKISQKRYLMAVLLTSLGAVFEIIIIILLLLN